MKPPVGVLPVKGDQSEVRVLERVPRGHLRACRKVKVKVSFGPPVVSRKVKVKGAGQVKR